MSKIDSIKRCLNRIKEVYESNPENLKNFSGQDSIVLNLQKACELSIDLANYVNSKYKPGIPKSTRVSFAIHYDNNID